MLYRAFLTIIGLVALTTNVDGAIHGIPTQSEAEGMVLDAEGQAQAVRAANAGGARMLPILTPFSLNGFLVRMGRMVVSQRPATLCTLDTGSRLASTISECSTRSLGHNDVLLGARQRSSESKVLTRS